MNDNNRYEVLEKARGISDDPDLDVLEVRRYLGVLLASDIENWLAQQPSRLPLYLDFEGVRAITMSVAEEVGPRLMQAVQDSPLLDQRYPIYIISGPEPAYTLHRAFESQGRAAPAIVAGSQEGLPATAILRDIGSGTTVVLGQLTDAMIAILRLAEERWRVHETLTSENLAELEFMRNVSPAARSKRLSELYARRLLAYRENPRSPRERLFVPAWRLGDEHGAPSR